MASTPSIVVIDNKGGGIFSFLPQATSAPAPLFERLFATPHDVDLVALAASARTGRLDGIARPTSWRRRWRSASTPAGSP